MDHLSKVQQLVLDNPDTLFYRWHGVTFSDQDVYSRLDKTFLYLLRPDGIVQRIIGYPILNKHKETQVEFTSSVAYRITTGKRKGRIVSPKKINSEERFETATIYKELRVGREPDELNPENRSDAFLIDALKDLVDSPPAVTSEITFPRLYLCCKGPDKIIYPRQSGDAFTYFSIFDEYDAKKTLEHNVRDIFQNNAYALDAGEDRQAYLFEYMYGRGVIAVNMELTGKWFSIKRKDATLQKDYIKLDLDI